MKIALRPVAPQRGAALLEVLVTVLLIAFGLLGLAGLISRGYVAEIEATQRAQALLMLQDMAARIENNRKNVVSYVTSASGVTATATCPTSPAADADKCGWAKLLAGSNEQLGGNASSSILPNAIGCVFQIDAPSRTYAVAVAWQGTTPTVAPNGAGYAALTCGQNQYGNEALRRVVAMPLVIGTLN